MSSCPIESVHSSIIIVSLLNKMVLVIFRRQRPMIHFALPHWGMGIYLHACVVNGSNVRYTRFTVSLLKVKCWHLHICHIDIIMQKYHSICPCSCRIHLCPVSCIHEELSAWTALRHRGYCNGLCIPLYWTAEYSNR